MFYSYFVYSILVFSICVITYYAYRNKLSYSVLWLPISIYAITIGCRYEVGTDWINYKEYYKEILRGDDLTLEYLYVFLNHVIAYFKLAYPCLFITLAFIHINCLYRFLLEHRKILFWGILLFFVGGPFISTLNIMRQATAFLFFILSIKYIKQHDWKRYIIMILIAYGFHSSSIILLPLYFVNRIDKRFVSYKFSLAFLFLISIFIGKYVMGFLLDLFFSNVSSLQYSRYEEVVSDSNLSYGLGFLVIKLVDFLLIFFASKLSNYNKNKEFDIIWWIYFIGVLVFNLGLSNELVIRFSYCMVSLRFIVLAYLCNYAYNKVQSHIYITLTTSVIILLNFLLFYSAIAKSHSGCSPFEFFFNI